MALKALYPTLSLSFAPELRTGNCYTYALNIKDMRRAWPGTLRCPRQNPLRFQDITKIFIAQALMDDGLIQIQPHCDTAKHIFAAVVSPSDDFHFFRKDHDGTWSHKLGPCPPEQIDSPENYLTYTDFVGYFTIPQTGILYAPY